MRRAKPFCEHAVFRNSIEHTVRSDDCSVDGASEHQEASHHDEALEQQPQRPRTREVHGNAADQIVKIMRANLVWNNRICEERYEGCKEKRINKNHEARTHQILVLGIFKLPINLRQGFFSRHCEDRMTKRYQDADKS